MLAASQGDSALRTPDPDYVVRDQARMSAARNYQRWQYDLIAPYLGRRILEVGCGIGNFTQYLAERGQVHGIDVEAACVEEFRRRFAARPQLTAEVVDVLGPDFDALAARRFDTVVCLNVLEHIRDDAEALRRFHGVLQPGGRVLLMVPAFQSLYGPIDERLGHYRRYTRRSLTEVAAAKGFRVRAARYFNCVGGIGWWINAKVLPRREQSAGQIAVFDSIVVPVMSMVERFLPLPFGQSVLGVLERPV
jgi:SAM-dependent methyltransferase